MFDATVEVLETTPAGQVLARPGDAPRSVYVRGVRVAEDDGLLFSYNVTKVDAKLRRALNRERSNVGRSAYTDRIKAILLAVETPHVLTRLVDDMAGFAKGATRDEVKWNDVAERVVRQLAVSDPDTVFVTAGQRWSHPELIRRAEIDGKHVFVIPDALAARLRAADDDTVTTLERFAAEWNDRVVIEPIDPSHLERDERAVLDLAGDVLAHRRPPPRRVGGGRVGDVAPHAGRHRDGPRPVGTGAAAHRDPPLVPALGGAVRRPPCCTRSATPSPAPPISPPSSRTASPTCSAPSAPPPSPPADRSASSMAMHVGTSGWSYDHWDGVLYPPGTAPRDRLGRTVSTGSAPSSSTPASTAGRADATFAGWRRGSRRLPAVGQGAAGSHPRQAAVRARAVGCGGSPPAGTSSATGAACCSCSCRRTTPRDDGRLDYFLGGCRSGCASRSSSGTRAGIDEAVFASSSATVRPTA